MRKIFSFMIVMTCVFFLGCTKNEYEEKHEHELSDWIIINEPTCLEKGLKIKKCNLCEEEIEREELNQTEHKPGSVKEEVVNDKLRVYTECDVCKTLVTEETLDITESLVYELNEDEKSYKVVEVSEEVENVVIPNEFNGLPVTVIGDYAFEEIENKFSIYIPSSIVLIEGGAFSYNTGLELIVIPASVEEISYGVFEGCTNLKKCIFKDESNLKVIGENAFADCNKLENIALPDSLEIIESGAFQMCNSFTSFTIPKNIKEIGMSILDSCEGLQTLIFDEGIENITLDIIEDCYNLESIIIPASVKEIEIVGLEGVNNLKSFEVNENNQNYKTIDGNLYSKDGKVLVKYAQGKLEKEVIIEETVKEIGSFAFSYSNHLEQVVISEGVTIISRNAFAECSNLKNITISDSVTNIDYYAFNGCEKLEYNVYDNAKYLGNKNNPYLFLISSLNFDIDECLVNKDTKHIASGAFEKCAGLTSLTFEDNCQLLSIGSSSFYGCSNLKYVEIPNKVVSIGNSAFGLCVNLESIIIPESVAYLGESVFTLCRKLTIYCAVSERPAGWNEYFNMLGIIIDVENHFIDVIWGYNEKVECLYEYTFNIDENTKVIFECFSNNVIIGKSYVINELGESFLFEELSSYWTKENDLLFICEDKDCQITLLCMNIHDDQSLSLYNCTEHEYVYLYKAPTCTEEGYEMETCKYCGSSKTNHIYELGHDWDWTIIVEPTETEEGVKIASCLRDGCMATIEMEIPKAMYTDWLDYELSDDETGYIVEGIGECLVENINIPPTYNGLPVIEIEIRAFENCENLKSIVIPETVKVIGHTAFANCKNLESVIFLGEVSEIGRHAFEGDDILEYNIYDNAKYLGNENNPYLVLVEALDNNIISCNINEETKTIIEDAFYHCESLENIVIPNGVMSIGDSAFLGCKSLVYNIYDNAKYLGNENNRYLVLVEALDNNIISCNINEETKIIMYDAFYHCESLENIVVPESVTSIGDSAFSECINLKSITLSEGLISIGYGVFEGCANLKNIVLPKSTTSIGRYAFYNCTNLESVIILSTITKIEENTFEACISLKSITFPDSLTYISYGAFDGCTSLTSITLPESVTSIGSYAFNYCTSLQNIVVSNSVNYIGSHAFSGCGNLTIYCEDESKPEGWSSDWNSSNCPVIWGYEN